MTHSADSSRETIAALLAATVIAVPFGLVALFYHGDPAFREHYLPDWYDFLQMEDSSGQTLAYRFTLLGTGLAAMLLSLFWLKAEAAIGRRAEPLPGLRRLCVFGGTAAVLVLLALEAKEVRAWAFTGFAFPLVVTALARLLSAGARRAVTGALFGLAIAYTVVFLVLGLFREPQFPLVLTHQGGTDGGTIAEWHYSSYFGPSIRLLHGVAADHLHALYGFLSQVVVAALQKAGAPFDLAGYIGFTKWVQLAFSAGALLTFVMWRRHNRLFLAIAFLWLVP